MFHQDHVLALNVLQFEDVCLVLTNSTRFSVILCKYFLAAVVLHGRLKSTFKNLKKSLVYWNLVYWS